MMSSFHPMLGGQILNRIDKTSSICSSSVEQKNGGITKGVASIVRCGKRKLAKRTGILYDKKV